MKANDKIKAQIGDIAIRLVEIKKIDYKNREGQPIILGWIQVEKRRKNNQGFTFLKDGKSFERINTSTIPFTAKSIHDLIESNKI